MVISRNLFSCLPLHDLAPTDPPSLAAAGGHALRAVAMYRWAALVACSALPPSGPAGAKEQCSPSAGKPGVVIRAVPANPLAFREGSIVRATDPGRLACD